MAQMALADFYRIRDDHLQGEFKGTNQEGPNGPNSQFYSRFSQTFADFAFPRIYSIWKAQKAPGNRRSSQRLAGNR